MKFKRENIQVALTQEMKEKAVASKIKQEERKIQKIKQSEELKAKAIKAEENLRANVAAISAREYGYGPMKFQLDLLWHDMDSGAIQIDKSNSNTWYHYIKTIKEETPLTENWQQLYNTALMEYRFASMGLQNNLSANTIANTISDTSS